MEQVRSFIAIELPEEVRSALTRIQSRLKSGGPPAAKWVDPNSIHLTLKFLGNVEQGKIAEIIRAIESAALGIPPLRLEVKGLGVFPNPRRVQVVWVGLSGDLDNLANLQQRIESQVSPLGFPTEARAFTPHLTLARVREQATPIERQAFGELVARTSFEEAHAFAVDSVNLMRSQLTRAGAIYSQTGSVKLKG